MEKDKKQKNNKSNNNKINNTILFIFLLVLLIVSTIILVKNKFGRYDNNDYYSTIINNQEKSIDVTKNDLEKMIKGLKSVTEFNPNLSKDYYIFEVIVDKDNKLYDATCLIKKNELIANLYINNEVESFSDKEEFAALYMGILDTKEYEEIQLVNSDFANENKNYIKIYKYKDKNYKITQEVESKGNFEIKKIQFEEEL